MSAALTLPDPDALPLPLQVLGLGLGALLMAGIGLDILLLAYWRRRPSAAVPQRRLAARPWTGPEAVFVALVLLATLLTLQCAAELVAAAGGGGVAPWLLVLQPAAFQAAAVGTAVYLMRRRGTGWRRAFGIGEGPLPLRLLQGAALYVAAMPVVVFYALCSYVLLQAAGVPVERQPVVDLLADPAQPLGVQLYVGVLAVAGAPLGEEILFRGIALPPVMRRLPPLGAMALVSLLFAGMHLTPVAVLPLFVFAMALSLAYLHTGSLLVPMVMHALFNGVSIAVLLYVRVFGLAPPPVPG